MYVLKWPNSGLEKEAISGIDQECMMHY